ncbi:MAG: PorV/PorQ family protein [Alistipes sp.]|nr:PorV/PorQ family protein [Alistipes sp.]
MTRRIILLSLSALMAVTGLRAQPLASAGLSPDARSAGLAGASVAMDAHSMSVFSNMAAAGGSDLRTEAGYGFSSLGNSTYLHAFGSYFRIDDTHTIAVGARYYRPDKIYNTQDGIIFTTFRPYDLVIDLGYAYTLTRRLNLSANVRYARSELNEDNDFKAASAVGIDLGLHYRTEYYTIAAAVTNAGTILDYGVAKYRMPASVRVGGAYRWSPAEGHRLTGLAEVRYNIMPKDYTFPSGAVGAEYTYRDLVAVRGGYNVASETKAAGNYGSVGAGVYIGPVTADFAYNIADSDSPMRNVWRVSAGVRF